MEVIETIAALDGAYDALLCDVWGVIHNGRRLYPGAAEALARFRERGGVVVLVTNVPKPRGPIPGQLDRLNFPRSAWDAIVTSGDAIREELAKRAPGPMYKIGPEHDESLWAGLGLERAGLDRAAFIGISGLNNDATETPGDYADILTQAKARDLDLYCANPDIVVRVGEDLIWCAGAIARDYAALGGRVIMAGKPHAPIYGLAFKELEALMGKTVDRSRVLCVGDGIGTDVKGAQAQGLDCLFIASGMHGEALQSQGRLDAGKVAAALAQEGVGARFVAASLG